MTGDEFGVAAALFDPVEMDSEDAEEAASSWRGPILFPFFSLPSQLYPSSSPDTSRADSCPHLCVRVVYHTLLL